MSHTQQEQRSVRQIAIWIDHREAIMAEFTDTHLQHEEELFSGVSPHTHGEGWSQQRFESHRRATLDHFYEEITQNLNGADEIIIYGSGQAKYELEQHINRYKGLSQHSWICEAFLLKNNHYPN
jgi:stalled ribosome rescue protein Dom34